MVTYTGTSTIPLPRDSFDDCVGKYLHQYGYHQSLLQLQNEEHIDKQWNSNQFCNSQSIQIPMNSPYNRSMNFPQSGYESLPPLYNRESPLENFKSNSLKNREKFRYSESTILNNNASYHPSNMISYLTRDMNKKEISNHKQENQLNKPSPAMPQDLASFLHPTISTYEHSETIIENKKKSHNHLIQSLATQMPSSECSLVAESSTTFSPNSNSAFEKIPSNVSSAAIHSNYKVNSNNNNCIQEVSLAEGKLYVCHYPGCNKTFRFKGNLKRHFATHTGEKPFLCSFCRKAFARKADVVVHYRVHTGEKPYVCSIQGCEKRFARQSDVRSHERTHIGDKPYACKFPDCHKRFSRRFDQRKHMASHKEVYSKAETQVSQPLKFPFILSNNLVSSSLIPPSERTYSSTENLSCDNTNEELYVQRKHKILTEEDCRNSSSKNEQNIDFVLENETEVKDLNKISSGQYTNQEECKNHSTKHEQHLDFVVNNETNQVKDLNKYCTKYENGQLVRHNNHIDYIVGNDIICQQSGVIRDSGNLEFIDESFMEIMRETEDSNSLSVHSCTNLHKLFEENERTNFIEFQPHDLHTQGCGHISIKHGQHLDFVVDNQLVCEAGIKSIGNMPIPCDLHKPEIGHLPVRHDNHIDYVVENKLFCQKQGITNDPGNLELLEENFVEIFQALDSMHVLHSSNKTMEKTSEQH